MEFKDNCAICRCNMQYKSVTKFLDCKHLFHTNCVEAFLTGISNCPICRAEIVGKELCSRRKYKNNLIQDRERIVSAGSRGEDWAALASTLGINYKTAHRWVASGSKERKRRGGGKPHKLRDEHIAAIVSWIETDCSLTLKQLRDKVFSEFNVSVTPTTVGNYLEGQLFTCKMVHKQPINMNSSENKNKRAEHVRMLNQYVQQGKQIVWMDETNFNLFCRMSRGRSRIGNRAVQQLPAARGRNIHLIGAISSSGIILMERQRGSFTSEKCSEWICHLVQKWTEMGNNTRDLVIVCDNAPCHSRIELAVEDNSSGEAHILRLGPYSPMLNPIENIWSKVKTAVRRKLRVPTVQGSAVCEQRMQYLEHIVDEAWSTVTGGDCARAVQHASTFYADVLSLNDMDVGQ